MACVNMYNPDGGAAFAGQRISFSSDFSMDAPPPPVQNRAMGLRCQEEDQNFEFSGMGSHPMMAADQLFSKGRILPFKGEGRPPTTLRDELRGDEERASSKGSSRWREMLGLRKSLCVGGGANAAAAAKKSDKVVAVDAEIAVDMAASKPQRTQYKNEVQTQIRRGSRPRESNSSFAGVEGEGRRPPSIHCPRGLQS